MPYIYLLTNTQTGEQYIGFTSQELEKRIKQHSYQSSGCHLIKQAIRKYGMDAFKCTILEHSSSTKDNDRFLNVLEPYYISKYNPVYNMTTGGDGKGSVLGPRYKSRVPVVQYDMRGVYIKRWNSAKEAGNELGILSSSITHVCKQDHGSHCAGGFQWRYAVENIQSLPSVVRKLGKRQVLEVKTGYVFESVTAAALYANVSKSAIVKYCKQGNEWKYTP
ncbi:MAG: hypothetical protein EBU08_16180 [Micrococcales bacterium]|jgi:GIY-YIG catalytic domain/NUMOD1 domain|nr:hypothetical protein [Micrococcales bacterium]